MIHRLVYCVFNNVDINIDHIDNNPDNNELTNLRLLTRSQNILVSKEHLRTSINYKVPKYDYKSDNCGNSKRIARFDLDGTFIEMYESIVEASQCTGINKSNIQDNLSGRSKTCHNTIWKYVK